MSTPQITPSIIHQESFTDLDFVTIILEALLYDDLITMDQYHDALESYQTVYLRLLNCFRCTPQQFYSLFGRDEHAKSIWMTSRVSCAKDTQGRVFECL